MLQQQNILLLPIKHYEETSEETERVSYIIKNANARLFHLRNIVKKYFGFMRSQYWHKFCSLRRYFSIFLDGIHTQKCHKLQNYFKTGFFIKMAKLKNIRLAKKERQNHFCQKFENSKLKVILKQWKKVVTLEILYKKLQQKKRKQFSKELIELLRENQSVMKRKKLEIATQLVNIRDLYCLKIAKNAFQCFKINTKMQKTVKAKRQKSFKQFIVHAKLLNKEEKAREFRMFRKITLSKCFLGWKQNYQFGLACRSDYRRLIYQFFNEWKLKVPYLQSEKQIQANNQIILKIHLQKRAQKLKAEILKRWRELTTYQKQVTHHNSILNKFAEKQYKYVLLRTYFANLKINCLNSKIKLKYYQTKLKRKVIDAFKIYFQNSINIQAKVLDFMDKRYLKRYFQKLKFFNKMENEKCRIIRLRSMFRAFSYSIISEYCQKVELASNFNRTNLLYKTVFALKKMRLDRKKQTYAIALINVILPLRRIYRNFRVTRHRQEKEWFLKKSILREWRMRVIRKDSQRKVVKEFNQEQSAKKALSSEQKLQMFQFQNIMATIAQIRSNFNSEKAYQQERGQQQKDISYSRINKKSRDEPQTPSQSIDFSYSLQTI